MKVFRCLCALPLAASAWCQPLPVTPETMPPTPAFFSYLRTGRHYFPTDKAGVKHCLYKITKIGTSNMTQIQPAPAGIAVTVTALPQAGSGFHSHQGGGRPNPKLLSTVPAGNITDATGCVTDIYQLPGYSGWYTFTGTASGYPPDGVNSYLSQYELAPKTSLLVTRGQPQYFVPWLDLANVAMTTDLHIDNRHTDYAGREEVAFSYPQTGQTYGTFYATYSRYGTIEFTRDLEFCVRHFAYNNAWGLELDIIRASLPHGGVADNQMASGSSSYTSAEWLPDLEEEHLYGVEFDIANPIIIAAGNVTAWLAAANAMASYGCHTGLFDPHGNFIGLGGNPQSAANQYWQNQTVIHVACEPVPLGFHIPQ
jgi:hypothetical protein